MKCKYISFLFLLTCMALSSQLFAQQETECNPLEGLPVAGGELIFNYGSVTNSFTSTVKSDVIYGQPLVGTIQNQDRTGEFGFWSLLRMPPQAPNVLATQGDFPDRVLIAWGEDPLGPASSDGFIVTRDGAFLTRIDPGIYEFIDFNVQAGEFYEYGVKGVNPFGNGVDGISIGFVNPNGVVTGKVTTSNGNPVPGATVTLEPTIGRSLQFNGNGDYICVSHDDNLPSDMLTLSTWVKIGATHDSDGIIDLGSDLNKNFWLHTTPAGMDKGVVFGVGDGTTAHTITHEFEDDPTTMGEDERDGWHHVTAVFGAESMILYIDGTFVESGEGAIVNEVALFSIGSRRNQSGFYDGLLDDIRIYDRLLTQTEIITTKNITVSKSTEGLVAYWKFDEGLGAKSFDLGFNEMHGTLTGTSFSADTPEIKNGAITDATGFYAIEGINYSEEQAFFANPEKIFYDNYALEFNAAYQASATLSNFDLPDTSHIEIVVHPFELNKRQSILSKRQGGTDAFNLYLENQKYYLTINGQTQELGDAEASYQHLALSLNGTTGEVTYYVDGTVENNLTYTDITGTWEDEAWLLGAKGVASPTNYYTGLIDEVVFYSDSLLTQAEIQLNAASFGNGGTDIGHGSLTSYFDLNEGDGTELMDIGAASTGMGEVRNASFSIIGRRQEKTPHEFEPNSRFININASATAIANVDFVDISTVAISGVIRYANTFCYADSVEVLVNGESYFPPIYTNAEGRFVADFEPGSTVRLTPVFADHEFFPGFFEVRKINRPVGGVLFQDLTKREVSGQVFGGHCRKSIIDVNEDGSLNYVVKVKARSANGCYEQVIQLDNAAGNYKFRGLPPLPMTISVIEHTDIMVYDYFQQQGGEAIDMRLIEKDTVDFMYISGPNVEIGPAKGFVLNSPCDENYLKQVRDTTTFVTNEIKVYESYLGQKCYLNGFDLAFVNNIEGSTFEVTSDTSAYQYKYYSNFVNTLEPYTNNWEVVATVGGATDSEVFEAIVLGDRKLESTFTTTSPEHVIAILHDPPGDASSASWSEGTELCFGMNIGAFTETSSGLEIGGDFGEIKTVYAGTPVGGIVETVGFKNEASVNTEVTVSTEVEASASFCNALEIEISTSDGDDIWGEDADIIYGASINFEMGASERLKFNYDTDTEQCSVDKERLITVDPTGYETEFFYTIWQVKTVVIPYLRSLGTEQDDDAADRWEEIIEENKQNRANFGEDYNYSFDAASTVTFTETHTTGLATSFSLGIEVTEEISNTLGLVGIGPDPYITSTVSTSVGVSAGFEIEGSTSTSTSFTFADDDLNDFYSVDVGKDPTYGTPLFRLKGGESMCPWIPGTRNREEVAIFVDRNTAVNVPANTDATFILTLGNIGPNGVDGLVFELGVEEGGNPDGAIIKVDGEPILQPVQFQFVGEESIQKTLTIEKPPGLQFDFEDLQLYFGSVCQIEHSQSVGYDPQDVNGGYLTYQEYSDVQNGGTGEDYYKRFFKNINLNVHYIEPCSPVDINFPFQDHVVTPGNENLGITLGEYENQDPDLELIRVQYRPIPGDGSWINIVDVPVADLADDPVAKIVNWDMIDLSDGNYQIRALTQCYDVTLNPGMSTFISIIKETNPPELFGAPEPADGILSAGDEISITFNEDINCSKVFDADGIGTNINMNNIALIDATNGTLVPFSHQCVGSKIIITPEIQPVFINGRTLRAVATAVEDLAGNVMEVPLGAPGSPTVNYKSWEFLVDLNPLRWEVGSNIEEAIVEGTSKTLTRNIVNLSGAPMDYTIRGNRIDNADGSVDYENIPAWMTVTPLGGTLQPGEVKPITFIFPDNLITDDFFTQINVIGSQGNKAIDVDVRVVCPGPVWELEPSQYTYTMNMTLQLDIEGEFSEDRMDRVAGFVMNEETGLEELRGWAFVQYEPTITPEPTVDNPNPEPGTYFAFLTLYSNEFSGEDLKLKVWDVSECLLYGQVLENFTYEADGVIGSPLEPQVIHTVNLVSRTIPIHQGWNWISYNVDLPDASINAALGSLTRPSGSLIKNQTNFAVYSGANGGFVGNLPSLSHLTMYQYRSDFIDSLVLTGEPIDPATAPIDIVEGWNWIGFIPQQGMPVADALNSLTPLNGDIVKSQTAFAQFVAGTGWIGNLDFMASPKGYLLKISNDGTLTYPDNFTAPITVENRNAYENYWEVQPHLYQYTMNMIGIVLDETNLLQDGDEVGAFVNGETRGNGQTVYVESLGSHVMFLTAYSNEEGETMTFKYYDRSADEVIDLQEQFTFEPNAIYGSVNLPEIWTPGQVSSTTNLEQAIDFEVYPNPAKERVYLKFNSTVAERIVIRVTDALGREVEKLETQAGVGDLTLEWIPTDLSEGLYFITLDRSDGSFTRKVQISK